MAENPSAFPHNGIDSDNEFSWPSTGMTLRDYFAAKAMQAFIAANTDAWRGNVAIDAYAQADAMLDAREATP